MNIAFFGSSLLSTYWNGAATYYRGMIQALAARGHRVTFYEPDAFERQQHRDMDEPPWARVVVYAPTEVAAARALADAQGVDVLIKTSGVGVLDAWLERRIFQYRSPQSRGTLRVFWDVDAPATLAAIQHDSAHALREVIPRCDAVLTYGGGPPVIAAYTALGARACHPIYNALDPEEHFPVEPEPRFEAFLGFLGNRLPDREKRVDEFFFKAVSAFPERRFLLGGSGWDDKVRRFPNLSYLGHVGSADHNAFNSSVFAVLNVNRESMAHTGYSPPTRVFEAAGAGACLILDRWQGVEQFLEPGSEVLLADDGDDVIRHLRRLSASEARAIGERARRRVSRDHTYRDRALEFETILNQLDPKTLRSRGVAAER